MSQQSVSDFDIIEGNGTVKNATHLTMIVDYDISGCGDENYTDTFPCEHISNDINKHTHIILSYSTY